MLKAIIGFAGSILPYFSIEIAAFNVFIVLTVLSVFIVRIVLSVIVHVRVDCAR